MERMDRALGPWVALMWGVLGTGFWALNAVSVVASNAEPSPDALLFALALTMTGMTIGITLNVVLALLRSGRYSDDAMADEQALWMLPMGIGMLGMATAHVFDGSLSTIDWVLLAGGSLASGFVLGTAPRARINRFRSTAPSPDGAPFTEARTRPSPLSARACHEPRPEDLRLDADIP